MRKHSKFFHRRIIFALLLCLSGISFAVVAFLPAKTIRGPVLALDRLDLHPRVSEIRNASFGAPHPLASGSPSPANVPTFGHPVISGVGGFGYEENLRPDPTNPARIYTSVPGSAAADTSWIWRSLDTGKTFKWVPAALPLEGKVTTCNGGGDTELGVDSGGHLYFNDLTLANFSTSRSDDFGASFTCSNTGVPDTVVDRQWYAIDGDPTLGGTVYLANDEVGPGGVNCSNGASGVAGNNVLVMYRSPISGMLGTHSRNCLWPGQSHHGDRQLRRRDHG